MLLLCYAVGRTTENKKAGTSRVVFLIELNSCKEGKKGRMNDRAFRNPNTASASFFLGFGENRDASATSLYHTCKSNSHTLLQNSFLSQLRTCTVGILVEIKASNFSKMTWQQRRFIPTTSWMGLEGGNVWDPPPAALKQAAAKSLHATW